MGKPAAGVQPVNGAHLAQWGPVLRPAPDPRPVTRLPPIPVRRTRRRTARLSPIQ